MKKKVCKICKRFFDEDACPVCKSSQTAASWKGRVYILDADKSQIARKMGIKQKGEYAIKVR